MTEHDQDAVVGRIVRESNKELRRLAALMAEAHKISEELCSLGKLLREHPEDVGPDADLSPLDAAKVRQLCHEIRETKERHLQLLKQKKDLGIDRD